MARRRAAPTTTAALGPAGGALAAVTVAATACAAWRALDAVMRARETSEVRVTARRTARNARVLEKCAAILERGYDAVGWLKNRHASTILSSLLRRDVNVAYQREVLAMPDGGHATLDWPMSVDGDVDLSGYEDAGEDACEIERRGPPFVRQVFDQSALVRRRLAEHHARIAADAPVLVLMSGIAGGSHDKYLKHFFKARQGAWISMRRVQLPRHLGIAADDAAILQRIVHGRYSARGEHASRTIPRRAALRHRLVAGGEHFDEFPRRRGRKRESHRCCGAVQSVRLKRVRRCAREWVFR